MTLRNPLMLLAATAILLPAAAHAQRVHGNKTICDTALAIFAEGSDQQRHALEAYVQRTLAIINAINVSHGNADLSAQLRAKPYNVFANELADVCREDISETVFVALGRTYKQEAGTGVSLD